jgi:DNA-directed RNA polymerase delta subunit
MPWIRIYDERFLELSQMNMISMRFVYSERENYFFSPTIIQKKIKNLENKEKETNNIIVYFYFYLTFQLFLFLYRNEYGLAKAGWV